MYHRYLLLFSLLVSVFSCSHAQKAAEVRYGWLDGSCFATKTKDIRPGTTIHVILLDDPQSISSAKISGRADAENCRPLSSERREQNLAEGFSFYQVQSKKEFGLGIGVIGAFTKAKVVQGVVEADIGDDGSIERFSLCTTSEGISFDIWPSKPFEKDPIWSGYYYLGYDVERSCP